MLWVPYPQKTTTMKDIKKFQELNSISEICSVLISPAVEFQFQIAEINAKYNMTLEPWDICSRVLVFSAT